MLSPQLGEHVEVAPAAMHALATAGDHAAAASATHENILTAENWPLAEVVKLESGGRFTVHLINQDGALAVRAPHVAPSAALAAEADAEAPVSEAPADVASSTAPHAAAAPAPAAVSTGAAPAPAALVALPSELALGPTGEGSQWRRVQRRRNAPSGPVSAGSAVEVEVNDEDENGERFESATEPTHPRLRACMDQRGAAKNGRVCCLAHAHTEVLRVHVACLCAGNPIVRWRAAEVRELKEDGRFVVCVDGDEEFVEE